jgi:hypothetical protein
MKKISTFFFVFTSYFIVAQTGGTSTFALLDLGFNARANGLGVDFITAKDQDVNLGVINPSVYNTKMNNTVGVNQSFLAGGISYGLFTYAKNIQEYGTFAGHLRYVNYGRMDRTDITGTKQGTFTPSEYILGAGFGRQLNPIISVGSNINLIYSQLESYNAFGLSMDLAGTYTLEKSNLVVTALVKNAGFQFKGYTQKNKAPLPADFQMAIAHKLRHAPFRFSLVAHHINRWDITYVDPNLEPSIDLLSQDTTPVQYASFGEKLANHFTYQVEVIVSKSIHLRTAFDYHRRQNLKVVQKPGIAGFSFGVGLYFKRITIDYGFVIYSKAGLNNTISLTSNLDTWKK